MTLRPDLRKHLLVGTVLAIYSVVMFEFAHPLLGVWVTGTFGPAALEWYQRSRGTGSAEWADFLWGTLPTQIATLLLAMRYVQPFW